MTNPPINPTKINQNYFSSSRTRWRLTPASEFQRRLDGIERELKKLFAEAVEHNIDLSAYMNVWLPYHARLVAVTCSR